MTCWISRAEAGYASLWLCLSCELLRNVNRILQPRSARLRNEQIITETDWCRHCAETYSPLGPRVRPRHGVHYMTLYVRRSHGGANAKSVQDIANQT